MASDVAIEHRLSAWNPNAEEIAAILIEMRPIVREFAERDALVHPAPSSGNELRHAGTMCRKLPGHYH